MPGGKVVARATQEVVPKLIELGLTAGANLQRPSLDDRCTKPPAQSQPISVGGNYRVCGGALFHSHKGGANAVGLLEQASKGTSSSSRVILVFPRAVDHHFCWRWSGVPRNVT